MAKYRVVNGYLYKPSEQGENQWEVVVNTKDMGHPMIPTEDGLYDWDGTEFFKGGKGEGDTKRKSLIPQTVEVDEEGTVVKADGEKVTADEDKKEEPPAENDPPKKGSSRRKKKNPPAATVTIPPEEEPPSES